MASLISRQPSPRLAASSLQHPRPAKRSQATFLGKSDDPASLESRVSTWLESVYSRTRLEARSEGGSNSAPLHLLPETDPAAQRQFCSAPERGQRGNGSPGTTKTRSPSQAGRSIDVCSVDLQGPAYRRYKLYRNHIHIKSQAPLNRLPRHIENHVADIRLRRRDTPDLGEGAVADFLDELCRQKDTGFGADVTRLARRWVLPESEARS